MVGIMHARTGKERIRGPALPRLRAVCGGSQMPVLEGHQCQDQVRPVGVTLPKQLP